MAEFVPCAQSKQLVCEIAAKVVDYFPSAQFRQILEADTSKYVPSTQLRQVVCELAAKVVEYFPALHPTQPTGRTMG